MIKRVSADFIAVALKAALVNHPPDDAEGRFYREIERSKPAPQGICVVNSGGKVLDWTLMFDDNKSMLAFFDHAKARFAEYPDARRPVAAEVYQRFPSQMRKDVEDDRAILPVLDRHPDGKRCPAQPPLRPGTVAVRLFGRALDHDGKPVADAVRQENYVEDRFHIEVETQAKLATVLRESVNGPVKLPRKVARQWVKQAYLGVLDVQPLDNPGRDPSNRGQLKHCEFEATKVESAKGSALWRVEGESEAFIDKGMANGGPGDMHQVKLKWLGFIELDGDRVTRLVLSASGMEKLKFQSARGMDDNEVAFLPGGRRIDKTCAVRFGFLGAPAGPDQVADDAPATREPGAPDEVGRQMTHALGPAFLVFRDKVQEELRLSDEQRQKIQKRLQDTIQKAGPFFQKLSAEKPEQREKELQAYRKNAQENLAAFLQGALKSEQLKRLRQVMLQHQGLFALGDAEVRAELEITDRQRDQFVEVVQQLQQKIETLMNKARNGSDPEEIRPKVMKMREEQASRIEAILNDAQKKRWTEMLGEPLKLDE